MSRILPVMTCVIAWAPAHAIAQAARTTPPPSPTEEIVVTATRSPDPIGDVPASVSVISAAQIADTPARSIDDILRRVPSVDLPIASTDEQHPTDTIVSMRGLSGIRALVLLDGVPLNDPFFGYVQWSEVPLDTIERVEVVRGGGATLWGNYAMGGVINILSRPIDRTELVMASSGGSRGTTRTDAHAAIAGRRYGIGLDVGQSHSDGYVEQIASARGPISVPTSFTAHTAAVSGEAHLSETLTARARAGWYDNDQTFLTRLNTNTQRNLRTTGSLGWRPDRRSLLELNGFFIDERFLTDNPGTPDGADPLAEEYVQNSHLTRAQDRGASLSARREWSGWLRALSAGIDWHTIRGNDRARIFDKTGALTRTDLGAGAQRFVGGFAQADLRPLPQVQVLASVRYQDFLSYDGTDDTPGGLGANLPHRHSNDVDPRLSLRWRLPAGFALRGAVYRAFRAPTLDNLYRAASVPGYILYGNSALAPETLRGAEAGFDYVDDTVRLQATAYDSVISNFITYRYLDAHALPPGFDIGARLINAGRARARGVEAELSFRAADALLVTLGYTYADSVVTRNAEDPASVGVQQPGIPKHRVSAGLDWTGPRGVVLSPRLRWLGATSGDPDAIYRTQQHLVVDLGGRVPLGHGVEGFAQIENLFDRRYIGTNDGFTAPLYGRPFTATAGVRVKLD